jgi:hypothetical protein
MKAVVLEAVGDPERLVLRDVPEPDPPLNRPESDARSEIWDVT